MMTMIIIVVVVIIVWNRSERSLRRACNCVVILVRR